MCERFGERVARKQAGEDFCNAKKFHEAKKETENTSRRRQAFQNHRDRQNQARPFGQASFHGHQARRPHAQAQEVDLGQPQGRRRNQANASLWLDFCAESQRNPRPDSKLRRNTAGRKPCESCQAALHGCLPADVTAGLRIRQHNPRQTRCMGLFSRPIASRLSRHKKRRNPWHA
jgi:hypothetical protein